ncbi:MAG TPA: hypothetical protein VG122_00055, partial [Gemmata sp.]|nr:hypothetical protein [Gemmata sp.]
MRFTLVAAFTLVGVSSAAFGQSGPYLATVIDSGAKLRANPSEVYPDTATLRQGDRLLVDHEEPNGWLAVQDAPGKLYSLSWVIMQFVDFDTTKPLPQNVTVQDDTTLAPGQIGVAQPLTYIRQTKIPAGTILTVVGQKVLYEGKSWYPVIPPSGDFRYIPKQLVRMDKIANVSGYTVRESSASQLPNTFPPAAITPVGSNIPPQPFTTTPNIIGGPPALPTVGTPVASGSSTVPTSIGSSPTAAKPVVQNPLWAQAEAAEQDGRPDDAEKLYFQLARLMNEPSGDHDIANMCYTRIHSLREKKRTSASGTTASTPRTTIVNPTQSVNANPTPTVGLVSPPAGGNLKPGVIASGKLTRSALNIDGPRSYALEDTTGARLVYVVPGQGVDLERCLNMRV